MLKVKSDSLLIGFDKLSTDTACLTVGRRRDRGYEIVKTLYHAEAEDLYERLTGEKVRETTLRARIDGIKLIELMDRDEAKRMKFGVSSQCPRCGKRVKPGLPEYHGLREFFCIKCGQKLKRF